MNILIAADIFPPSVGGPATYSFLLLRELSSMGYTISILTLTPKRLPHEPAGVFRVIHSFFPLRYFEYYRLLKKHGQGVDIIYAMGPVNAGLPALFVARALRKPLVVKVVGDYAWEQGVARFGVKELPDEFQHKRYGLRVSMLRWIEQFVCKRARAVVVPSEYLKKIVMGWGVSAESVHVIYNAAPNVHAQSSETLPSVLQNRKIIFSAGRLMPWKGMQTLVEIMPELVAHDSSLHLVIAGSGPEKETLVELVKKLKLEHAVTLLGKAEAGDMQAWFQQAHVFVLNSGYEGMAHTILEAFAYGCPVVASNTCGNPELVAHEKTGLLCEYNDAVGLKKAIIRLVADQDLRGVCITHAKEKMALLSQKNMLENTINLLKRFVRE